MCDVLLTCMRYSYIIAAVLHLSEEQVMAKCVAQAQTLATADIKVMDPETMLEVPADGTTMGEVMIKGNNVMKGYFKNPVGTAEAFHQGWFHSGDLGVMHANGRFEIKDRSKGQAFFFLFLC